MSGPAGVDGYDVLATYPRQIPVERSPTGGGGGMVTNIHLHYGGGGGNMQKCNRTEETSMSWSISLGGPKSRVAEELSQAIDILRSTENALRRTQGENVYVEISGSSYGDGEGNGSSIGTFNVGGLTPKPEPTVENVAVGEAPAPSPAEPVAQADGDIGF